MHVLDLPLPERVDEMLFKLTYALSTLLGSEVVDEVEVRLVGVRLVCLKQTCGELRELRDTNVGVEAERVRAREARPERLVLRRTGDCSQEIAAHVESKRRERRITADITPRVHRRLVDRLRVDALELVRRDRVENDLEAEVGLESLPVEKVATLTECDREHSTRCLDEEHSRRRSGIEASQISRHVRVQEPEPSRGVRRCRRDEQRRRLSR